MPDQPRCIHPPSQVAEVNLRPAGLRTGVQQQQHLHVMKDGADIEIHADKKIPGVALIKLVPGTVWAKRAARSPDRAVSGIFAAVGQRMPAGDVGGKRTVAGNGMRGIAAAQHAGPPLECFRDQARAGRRPGRLESAGDFFRR